MTKIVETMLKPMPHLIDNLEATSLCPLISWAYSFRFQVMANSWQLFLQSRPMADSSINMGSYRTLFPFFLIIAVVLLLVWRLLVSPGLSTPTRKCPEGTSSYWAQPGDSCWEISRKNGWSLDKFKEINPAVVCDPLIPGTSVCLPPLKKQTRRQVLPWYMDTFMDTYEIRRFIQIKLFLATAPTSKLLAYNDVVSCTGL